MNLSRLKNSYLTHIKIHIESQNPDSKLIRDFADRWFAYYKQGPFLNKNNRERWFNGLHADKLSDEERNALLQMHFISKDALLAIKKQSKTKLIKDHSIPIKKISEILLQQKGNPLEKNIEQLLLKFYSLGVITFAEDLKLNQIKLKSKMPEDWDGDAVFARYDKAGIKKAKL